jgi:hypothetical protein
VKNQTLEDLILATNKQPKEDHVVYYNDQTLKEMYSPIYLWIKKHWSAILIFGAIGFSLGYYASEAKIEMDCKYAKSVRINTVAFKCERII